MASIFSKIIAGEIPSYKIYEDDQFYSFLDISPMTKGHVLVIPKEETDYIFDIDDDQVAQMFVVAKKISQAIKKAIPCKRVGVMVLGMEVPHAHIHLIPINKESDMNLTNPRLIFTQNEFEVIAADIRQQL